MFTHLNMHLNAGMKFNVHMDLPYLTYYLKWIIMQHKLLQVWLLGFMNRCRIM